MIKGTSLERRTLSWHRRNQARNIRREKIRLLHIKAAGLCQLTKKERLKAMQKEYERARRENQPSILANLKAQIGEFKNLLIRKTYGA